MSNIVYYDKIYGCIYVHRLKKPNIITLSEILNPKNIIRSIKQQVKFFRKEWVCIHRFSNQKVINWSTAFGAIPLRKTSDMKIVFKWIGEWTNKKIPQFWIEDGYKEGT